MSQDLQQDAIEVQKQIVEQDYYVNLYNASLQEHGMTHAGIEQAQYTNEQIVDLANTFWFALPDSPAIRRQPFFQLCDIAEHCFDEPD